MSSVTPGQRQSVVFTKQTVHGDPCIEGLSAGVARKSKQAAPGYPSAATRAANQIIEVGEEAVIIMHGKVPVANAKFPGGTAPAAGTPIYITKATNALVLAATAVASGLVQAAYASYGVAEEADISSTLHTMVNLNKRDQC